MSNVLRLILTTSSLTCLLSKLKSPRVSTGVVLLMVVKSLQEALVVLKVLN